MKTLFLVIHCLDTYGINVLIGFDCFVNALTGGSPAETISGRTARAARNGWKWAIALRWFLDHLQPQHCERAEADDFDGHGRHREALGLDGTPVASVDTDWTAYTETKP